MKLLITGGCGFLGSNLASDALGRGYELLIFDNLSRNGSSENLSWLQAQGNFKFEYGDIRNKNDVNKLIQFFKPDVIFHLAGQVAMTTSITNPVLDFEVNVLGTFNLLEAIRQYCPNAIVIYSSTNKVYGDLRNYTYIEEETRYKCIEKPNGFDEETRLEFHSPYGVSKGAADQYILDYGRMFGINTVVFRHSSMYGGRQFATYDQGWVGWFCSVGLKIKKGLLKEKFTIAGNGKQVRDVLHADDLKRLYFCAINNIETASGEVFNIGGGVANSLSLLELFSIVEEKTGSIMLFTQGPERASDQKVFIADISKVKNLLGWTPQINTIQGIEATLDWVDKI